MKHRVGYNRLGRKPSHRKALHRNMVTSLFLEERIRTTRAKAQAIRRTAEKMITRAKEDTVHNRRIVGKDIKDKAARISSRHTSITNYPHSSASQPSMFAKLEYPEIRLRTIDIFPVQVAGISYDRATARFFHRRP